MRLSLILLLFASCLFVYGQNANVAATEIDAPPPPMVRPKEPPANSTLHARVFYEDTGRPIRRTSVMLVSAGRGGGRESSGVTDEKGNLEIKNVQAGKYLAIVNAPGTVSPLTYVDTRKNRNETAEAQFAGLDSFVVNGLTDVEMQFPVKRGGAISGRVTYADGDPAVGVSVSVLRKVDDDFVPPISNFSILSQMMTGGAGVLSTDDRGYFRMAGLPAGEYIVKVSENVKHSTNESKGYSDPFESVLFGSSSMVNYFFDNAFDKQSAKLIPLGFGEEKPELSLTIPEREMHTIEGKVVAAKDKLPIRNSTIYLQIDGEDPNADGALAERRRQSCMTDDNGNWKFKDLPKGKYKLLAEADGSELDVANQVYGPIIANAANAMANYPMSNRPSNLPPAKRFAKMTVDVSVEDKDVTDKVIELSFGSTVSGTVTTENGKPLPTFVTVEAAGEEPGFKSSTQVYNMDFDREEPGVRNSADFQMQGVAPGKTFFKFTVTSDEFYIKSATAGALDLLKEPYLMRSGDDLKGVKIIVANDVGSLKGNVIDGEKEPLPGLRMWFVPTDPAKFKNQTFMRSTVTNATGDFETKLPPMEYAVVFLPANFTAMKRSESEKWLTDNIKDAQKFTIESGKTEKITVKREVKKPKTGN